MDEHDAAQQEHLAGVPEREAVAQPSQHHERDDVEGVLRPLESRLIWPVTLAQVICPARGRWAGDAVCGLRFGRRHRAAGAHGPGLPPIRCRDCGKQSNGRSAGLPNRAQYPSNVIALVVLWRLRYRLALRDPSEMFLLHGIVFSQEAVREWEAKLAPVLAGELRRRRHGRGGARGRHWHVDETCL